MGCKIIFAPQAIADLEELVRYIAKAAFAAQSKTVPRLTRPRRWGKLLGMPKTLTEVTRDAAELPPSERLKLARILLDLSEADTAPVDEVQAAWDDEIERRLEELRTGKARGVPLEEVKKRIEARFRP